ncbi:MAG: hypothetical protein C4518_16415 [Desulfobacteraceae bacterium]|nr:MAG: hypothetical protein C4518_16415 [Desulfobacteraceae bacterium]
MMSEKINLKDRATVLKLITVSVCAVELFIAIFTIVYQQDQVKRVETPISEEMAKVYIDHPEKLKENERLALNVYHSRKDQRTYLIVKEVEEVVPFPWKAWVLISVGFPIGLAFLVLLVARAYFQAVEPGGNEPDESAGKAATGVNKLSQINSLWFLLIAIVVIFLVWYIPEIVKYTGSVAINWLTTYWWVPATVFFVIVFIIVMMIYLQYRLKSKALDTEVEIAKLKFLQYEGNHQFLLENPTSHATHLLEEVPHGKDQ